ncbi:DMT family transporter [Desulfitobacterium sp.]|uniref:DMT family transporter n=1 Tax=Desulfitobacterium sp. TaxID=49981 RepID=UPI002B202DC7|nr:DMT family transporter [Desulfitobacterium sp.]MEA4902564.1 DMT family transporter [Desulfitobacterium sp.]
MFISHLGEIAALTTAFCWAVSSTSFEVAGKKVGSLSVNLIRLVFAFIFISGYNFLTRGMLLPFDASSSTWFWLLISGLVGFVLGDLFLFQAFVEVGSRISQLIMSIVPPITAILGFFFLGEKITLLAGLGMVITLSGIALVIMMKDPGEKKVKLSHSMKGITFAFLGACGQAFGLVLSKIGMGTYDPFAATQIRIIAGIFGFIIVITFLKGWGNLHTALKNRQAMRWIATGSVFGPFLGVSLSLYAVQLAPTGVVSTLTSITPILLIPVSLYGFKEKVRPQEILGAFISLIGVSLLFL